MGGRGIRPSATERIEAMSRRRIGMAAAVGLGVTALLGFPRVMAQDSAPEPASGAETSAEPFVTFSGDGGPVPEFNGVADLEFVALDAGCRVFDTRGAQGPLLSNVDRAYSVTDGAVPGQGGAARGCGIPASARAVDVSLSTLADSPTGTGFLRAGIGGRTPTATVLQFRRGQGISATHVVPLDDQERFTLRVSGANTGMVGDVLGYWESTLHATVDFGGSLIKGNGVTQVSSTAGNNRMVTFDRDVSRCTAVAADNVGPGGGNNLQAFASGSTVVVASYTPSSPTPTISDFTLSVVC